LNPSKHYVIALFEPVAGLLIIALDNATNTLFPTGIQWITGHYPFVAFHVFFIKRSGYLPEKLFKPEFPLLYINAPHKNNV
jgi:hypothetical protein